MKIIIRKDEKLIKALIHNVQGMSFSSAQKSIRLGNIKINGKRVRENIDVKVGDEIEVFEFMKSKPNVSILYEDNNILIVNKPAGIECATRDKSSANTYSLEELFSEYGAIVVHRLDRLTEGLVILARNKSIAQKFENYFRNRLITKQYLAGVLSKPASEGTKTAYLKKDSKNSIVTISDIMQEGFKEIITEYYIKESNNNTTLLDIILHTGRTHQIRGYFSHIGCPIIGDDKYGSKALSTSYKGYFLTAYKLQFNLKDELKYINDLTLEISPSWLEEYHNIYKKS